MSIVKIFTEVSVEFTIFTYIVLGVAIVLKLLQCLLYRDFGKSINSEALKASAADSRNDVFTTVAVLISSIIIATTGVNIDGYVGVAVSIVIIIFSFKLIKDTLNPLIGTIPDKELVNKIAAKLSSYDVVMGCHDLMIHSYGPAITFASVHVEVDATGDIMEMHDAIDNIERDFMHDMNVHLVIHMDPIAIGDEETDRMKGEVERALLEVETDITIHDFRLVKGPTHTNVLFDVVVPYKSDLTAKKVKEILSEKIQGDTTYYYVITVDNKYA